MLIEHLRRKRRRTGNQLDFGGQRKNARGRADEQVLQVVRIALYVASSPLRRSDQGGDLGEIWSDEVFHHCAQLLAGLACFLRHQLVKVRVRGREANEVLLHQPKFGHIVDASQPGNPVSELRHEVAGGGGEDRLPEALLALEMVVDAADAGRRPLLRQRGSMRPQIRGGRTPPAPRRESALWCRGRAVGAAASVRALPRMLRRFRSRICA